ncbi:MAG: hypothetical protein JWM58_1066 [Rhizobium sp.]|nr:hypothetical protein [Rhizobium sp.]
MHEKAIAAKLDRLSELMFTRDRAIIDALWSDGFRLIGSEKGEVAETRDQLESLFNSIFTHPARFRWAWDERSVTIEDDIAWVFAEGHVEIVHADHVDRRPYRLVAIFHNRNGDWRWRLFSGSEPA